MYMEVTRIYKGLLGFKRFLGFHKDFFYGFSTIFFDIYTGFERI